MENPKTWTLAHWAIDLAIRKYKASDADGNIGGSLISYIFDELKTAGFIGNLPAENTFVSPYIKCKVARLWCNGGEPIPKFYDTLTVVKCWKCPGCGGIVDPPENAKEILLR